MRVAVTLAAYEDDAVVEELLVNDLTEEHSVLLPSPDAAARIEPHQSALESPRPSRDVHLTISAVPQLYSGCCGFAVLIFVVDLKVREE